MNDSDAGGFGDLVATMCEVFQRKFTTRLTEVYWKALKGFGFNIVEQAVESAMMSQCQTMPPPARLVEIASDKQREQQLKLESTKYRHHPDETPAKEDAEQIMAAVAELRRRFKKQRSS